MSETSKSAAGRAVKARRLVVRLALVALYLVLAVFVFVNGRAHTFLIDNKSSADGSIQALRQVKVFIDNHDPIELMARDRELLMVRGQTHRIRIETQSPATRLEGRFTVPFDNDMILLSIPKLAAGIDEFWEHFVIVYERPTNNDAPVSPEEAPLSIEPTL